MSFRVILRSCLSAMSRTAPFVEYYCMEDDHEPTEWVRVYFSHSWTKWDETQDDCQIISHPLFYRQWRV